jgi:ribonuclease P protein component
MLPHSLRFPLRHSKTFFQDAQKTASPPFLFYIVKNKAGVSARAAVIVPKKVSLKAVVRNKIKRLVYQQLSSTLPHLESIDVVVYVLRLFDEKHSRALDQIPKFLEKYKRKNFVAQTVSPTIFAETLKKTS